MKSDIKLWFFPKVVGTAIKNNALVPSQLTDPKVLNDILSDRVVGKIQYLNNLTHADGFNRRILATLGLEWIQEYACNSTSWSVKWLPNNIIAAMAEDGDELLSSHIAKQLQHFYVPFTVVCIRDKEYGILFDEGIAIDEPGERFEYLKRDMGSLLTLLSSATSSSELVFEPAFHALVEKLNV